MNKDDPLEKRTEEIRQREAKEAQRGRDAKVIFSIAAAFLIISMVAGTIGRRLSADSDFQQLAEAMAAVSRIAAFVLGSWATLILFRKSGRTRGENIYVGAVKFQVGSIAGFFIGGAVLVGLLNSLPKAMVDGSLILFGAAIVFLVSVAGAIKVKDDWKWYFSGFAAGLSIALALLGLLVESCGGSHL